MIIKGLNSWTTTELRRIRELLTKREAKLRAEVLGPVVKGINDIDLEIMRRSNET